MKGKMAIIGDGDGVLVFKSVGMDAYCAENPESAKHLLRGIAKEYQIIFITDVLAKQMEQTISEYAAMPYPILVSVPSMSGGNGYGYEVLRRESERALGINILYDEEKGNERK